MASEGVQPQPSPCTVRVERVMGSDGNVLVRVTLQTLTGTSVTFWSLDAAKDLSALITQIATGIHVARGAGPPAWHPEADGG